MMKEEQIKIIAETLLPGFIPKDVAETELSFHFTVPPNQSFKVWFTKNNQSKWAFKKFDLVQV
ncbi:hypothetical protein AAKU52_002202 [Pedobacter sp. CG_S7]|uniref:hypothetical protein n=1 Tax=Pedobacter sp. CG_S7 TaxID=3143930 RepID=UPI00339513E4